MRAVPSEPLKPWQPLSSQAVTESRVAVEWAPGILITAAVISLFLSLIAYFTPNGAVAGSEGALLVLVSTALLLFAALLTALARMPPWLVTLFKLLTLLDIIGTAICAYFLETDILLAVLVIAFIGWALQPFSSVRRIADIRQ
jgi:hypothetical protein